MSQNKTAEWHPFETKPKDGITLIVWISSQKEFQDTTANFSVADEQWWWANTEEVLQCPNLPSWGE
jgi:hypothetical protein